MFYVGNAILLLFETTISSLFYVSRKIVKNKETTILE